MSDIRQRIIDEARTWIGTPYHCNAAVKGPRGGVDCGRFPLEVFRICGLPVPATPPHWPGDWFLHDMADSEPYLALLQEVCFEVAAPLAGDLALFRLGRAWAHTAIVTAWPALIHTRGWNGAKQVETADARLSTLARRPVRFFRSNFFA